MLKNPEHCPADTKYNYYFSHLYNCPFDCEYCFLQGMYLSANFVLFVNYEDFQSEIKNVIKEHSTVPTTFFSGYDCDSLALEQVTGFAESFIPWFEKFDNAFIELRTKSSNIGIFQKLQPTNNAIIAWTLTPEEIQKNWENKTSKLEERVAALKKLQTQGWKVGIRIEPLILFHNWREAYEDFFSYLEKNIDFKKIHNLFFGQFRLPKETYKKILKMRPKSTLLTKYYELSDSGEMTYPKEQGKELFDFVYTKCKNLVSPSKIFYY